MRLAVVIAALAIGLGGWRRRPSELGASVGVEPPGVGDDPVADRQSHAGAITQPDRLRRDRPKPGPVRVPHRSRP